MKLGRREVEGSNRLTKSCGLLLLQKNCTVTIAHSHTKDLAAVTRSADILVVAVGRAGFITGDMIKPGAVVIDIGINPRPEGGIVGDVHFDSAVEVAGGDLGVGHETHDLDRRIDPACVGHHDRPSTGAVVAE